MPILNYSTEVSVSKTVADVTRILTTKGAHRVTTDYDQFGNPTALEFTVTVYDQPVAFRLPCKVDAVFASMTKYGSKVPPRFQNREQARKVAWRIIKDWVEAQMALIECGQAELAEVFFPYALEGSGERTCFQVFAETKQKALTPAPEHEALTESATV